MPAHVIETAEYAVEAACNDQRFAHEFGGEVVPRIRDLAAMAHDLPGP